jgi:predicted nucleotidyltransferase
MVITRDDLVSNGDSAVSRALYTSALNSNLDKYDDITSELEYICMHELCDYDAEIYFFGSRTFGLSDESSDLDIFIDLCKIIVQVLINKQLK